MYYDKKFKEYSGNIKKTWDTLREIIGKHKNRINIPDFFCQGGKTITGSKNIAEGFNDFFANIGPELANSIPPSTVEFSSYLGESIKNNFTFCKVTPGLILETGEKIKSKSSCGPDNISSKLLKIILPIINQPLCHLFNLSFQTGYIPEQFKTAKVVPIYKSGDKHNYSNYRPISFFFFF